jgi:hypothetical protein
MYQSRTAGGGRHVRHGEISPAMTTRLTLAAFVMVAIGLVATGLFEPSLVMRSILFLLAAVVGGGPFLLRAATRKRDARDAQLNADAQAKRQGQTRRELRRMLRNKIDMLSARMPANDDADARRAEITRFAAEELLPHISHALIASERPLWLQEVYAYAETLLAASAPQVSTTGARDLCLEQLKAAGWDAVVDGALVTAQVGDVRAVFQCHGADAAIDEAAVATFVALLRTSGVPSGAIVSDQSFTPEALQAGRASGVGLIRPTHMPAFLAWLSRGQEPARAQA